MRRSSCAHVINYSFNSNWMTKSIHFNSLIEPEILCITCLNGLKSDFCPTWAEVAELLGRSRWSLLFSWELMTSWSCSLCGEVWISSAVGRKRPRCLCRLPTSVCLQVLSPFPTGGTKKETQGVKNLFVQVLLTGFYTSTGNIIFVWYDNWGHRYCLF